MSVPTTMFHLTGRAYPPAKLSQASLVIIDAQKEYLSGPLALSGMDEAVANIAKLLDAARKAGRPIIHVRHLGTVGGLFDPQGSRGEFIPGLDPQAGETVIEKRMPNAFKNTDLHETLQQFGTLDLIVCGFMSHSSVSTTVRRAKDYGYRCTLVDDASATRDLAYKDTVIPAVHIHQGEMAVMADNFACVASTASLI